MISRNLKSKFWRNLDKNIFNYNKFNFQNLLHKMNKNYNIFRINQENFKWKILEQNYKLSNYKTNRIYKEN